MNICLIKESDFGKCNLLHTVFIVVMWILQYSERKIGIFGPPCAHVVTRGHKSSSYPVIVMLCGNSCGGAVGFLLLLNRAKR